jgi:hypothetical protein
MGSSARFWLLHSELPMTLLPFPEDVESRDADDSISSNDSIYSMALRKISTFGKR